MGFSVSGAAAIVFASLFIAFGMWYSAAGNSFERVADAEADRTDGVLEQRNTDVRIANATHNDTQAALTVEMDNAGASQLRLSASDLLVDGEYVTGWPASTTVEGDAETDLWLANETATITLDRTAKPDRVKVVTEAGVSDVSGVTAA